MARPNFLIDFLIFASVNTRDGQHRPAQGKLTGSILATIVAPSADPGGSRRAFDADSTRG
jgi:hypothetical protein